MLMDLRETKLADDNLRREFCQKIIDTVTIEGNYLILLCCDSYDVPFKSKDGDSQADNSDETYTFILCAICPVKQTKANLHYVPEEKLFHDGAMNQMVSAPALGFLFPAFDDRATNIYNALYYTHDITASQDALIEAVFNTPVPQPAAEQKKSFEALLTTSLGDDCSLDVVQTVHDQLCQPSAPAAKRKNHPPQQQKGRKGQYAGEPCALSCRPHRPARQRPHRRGQQRGEQDHIELPRGNIIAVQRITT